MLYLTVSNAFLKYIRFQTVNSESSKAAVIYFPTPTDQLEIRNIILYIKNSAPGHGGLSSKAINTVIDTLIPLLTNLSLTEAFVPLQLKIAKFYHCIKNMLFDN